MFEIPAVDALADGHVHVHYRLMEGLAGDDYRSAFDTLSPDERVRAGRFVFAADRERFVGAHALLRHVLSAYAPVDPVAWTFVVGNAGKPGLADDFASLNLWFNLSHTRGLVACAVARQEVGIDVEALDRRVRVLEIASRFFSPTEVAWLRACADEERHERFLSLWTLKEAYVKAIGAGLSHALDTFGFALGQPPALIFEAPTGTRPADWFFALFEPSPRHRMALAVGCRPDAQPRVDAYGAGGRPIGPIFSTRQARPTRRGTS